ncbi:Nuclear pore complex protein Nup88 [Trichinella murrelli]|uniref:Nuclear pore complex protein Nup88 n=2 Tax=Trichinella TaxID=6333 RepID=A0A0V0TAE0_9BILA|nr:Nuclear pore complex protein Nup88 [Trichinella murrelli]
MNMENDLSFLYSNGSECNQKRNFDFNTDVNVTFAQRKQLFAMCGRNLLTWIPEKSCLEIAKNTIRFSSIPTQCVNEVRCNSLFTHAALISQSEVVIVHLPAELYASHYSVSPTKDGHCQAFRSAFVDLGLHRVALNLQFLCVRWHPCYLKGPYLMALCNDNTLRMYDAFSCKKPLQIVSLDPSKREIGMSTLNPKYFIGDSAVTFDFGSPLDTKEVEQDGPQYWPIFVVHGCGEIRYVLSDTHNCRFFEPSDSLSIFPLADDNYDLEVSDVLCLENDGLSVLAVASSTGKIYHLVIFQDKDDDEILSCISSAFSLHVHEIIQLPWYKLVSEGSNVSTSMCTVFSVKFLVEMYDAFSCKKPLQIVSLDPSKREIGMSTLNPKYFIGDSAVTFDFGSPLDTKEVEQDGPQYWPIFVVHGCGEIRYVLSDTHNCRFFEPSDSLSIFPLADDNYDLEVSDVLCLENDGLSVLAVASSTGKIYHLVIFQDKDDDEILSCISSAFSLHVHEIIQLPWYKLVSEGSNVSTSMCTVFSDYGLKFKYVCYCSNEIYMIHLRWLEDFVKIKKVSAEETRPTSVDFLLKMPSKASSVHSEFIGVAFVNAENQAASFHIALTSDFSITTIRLPHFSDASDNSADRSTVEKDPAAVAKNSSGFMLEVENNESNSKFDGRLLKRVFDMVESKFFSKLKPAHQFVIDRVNDLERLYEQEVADLDALSSNHSFLKIIIGDLEKDLDVLQSNNEAIIQRTDVLKRYIHKENAPLSTAEAQALFELRQMEASVSCLFQMLRQATGELDSFQFEMEQIVYARSKLTEAQYEALLRTINENDSYISKTLELLTAVKKLLDSTDA